MIVPTAAQSARRVFCSFIRFLVSSLLVFWSFSPLVLPMPEWFVLLTTDYAPISIASHPCGCEARLPKFESVHKATRTKNLSQ
jgi:hypothetical protein